MPIVSRKLKPGTVLVARYKKQDYKCTVVKGEDGELIYRLHGGEKHKSPSSAGVAVKGEGKTCDGWEFWSVEGASPVLPRAKREQRGSATPTDPGNEKPKPKTKPKGRPKAKAEKPIKCGDCSREFPTSREAAQHMRDDHGSVEAVGNGGPS